MTLRWNCLWWVHTNSLVWLDFNINGLWQVYNFLLVLFLDENVSPHLFHIIIFSLRRIVVLTCSFSLDPHDKLLVFCDVTSRFVALSTPTRLLLWMCFGRNFWRYDESVFCKRWKRWVPALIEAKSILIWWARFVMFVEYGKCLHVHLLDFYLFGCQTYSGHIDFSIWKHFSWHALVTNLLLSHFISK